MIDTAVSDLERYRPGLVLVKTHHLAGFGESEFRLLDFFLRDRRFAEQWAEYRLISSLDYFDVYRREPDPAEP